MPLPTNNLRPSPAPYSSGRGLFLTQRVDAGQLVLHIPNPLVAVPDDKHLGSCCSWCLKWDAPVEKEREAREKEKEKEEEYPDPGIEIEGEDVGKVELVRCSGCKVVWYCGKNCQKHDFHPRHSSGIHKLECPIYSTLHTQGKTLPTSVRVLIKLLLLHSHFHSRHQDPPWWSSLLALESHATQQLTHPQRAPMLPIMAKAAAHYSSTNLSLIPEELILSIYCRTLVNSFSITAPSTSQDVIGTLFDPYLALFNHSCEPNCVMEFDGRGVLVYAVKEMAVGEEATIAYVDVEGVRGEERRRELRERWFFECGCGSCKREMGRGGCRSEGA